MRIGFLILASLTAAVDAAEVRVHDRAGLLTALEEATAGTTILIEPGRYIGDFSVADLNGEPGKPIIIRAADPSDPPVLTGGRTGFHISRFSHLEIRDIRVANVGENGLNLDDGGRSDQPSHHLLIVGLNVDGVGPKGNRDGIKLSGIDDFEIAGAFVGNWGDGGSGIDMVGCHRGKIDHCVFASDESKGANGVQAKGGSSQIAIRRCRFQNAGERAVNLGGSTGKAYFRPISPANEASDLIVEDCSFFGSDAAIAYVGCERVIARHNTIIRPRRYAVLILQENTNLTLAPCRENRFEANLIAYEGSWAGPFNIGPNTAPETFIVNGNAWFRLDGPEQAPRTYPFQETNRTAGVDPKFFDANKHDFRLREDSDLRAFGARE
jgi:Right handed beta helix region